MKRMMTTALAVTLVALSTGEVGARTYSIGRIAPDVVLEADPDLPYGAQPGNADVFAIELVLSGAASTVVEGEPGMHAGAWRLEVTLLRGLLCLFGWL